MTISVRRTSSDSELLFLLRSATAAIEEALSKVSRVSLASLRSRTHRNADQFKFDLVADAAAVEVLSGTGVGILSEESGFRPGVSGITVIVDPIDGSTNCSRGIASYGPSLCAIDDDGPRAAVVKNLPLATEYTAIRGSGAWKNGVALCSAKRDKLEVIVTGDPCPKLERPVWSRVLGASAHDLCLVAEGVYDGYFDWNNTQSVWDYLAASLVVLEVGGEIRDLNGKRLCDMTSRSDRRIIAGTTPDLCRELEELAHSRGVL